MDAKNTNNRIAAAAVALFVSVTVLIGGGIALAGASDAGPASGEHTTSASTSSSTSTSTAALDEVTVTEPVKVSTSIAPATTTEPDCDAFFAELDAEHNANNQAFVEVLDRFDIANELIVDGGYTWVEFNYDDPIADTISQSFWSRLAADEDPLRYDHPCFEFEGCEGFDEGFEYDDAEDDIAVDDIAETDTADYEEEPELTDEEWAELDAQWEAEWEQMLAEHNAAVEALAAALAEAGVEHELNVEYDWATLTFDLDNDRAIPVVAALR